jgi:restriction endonuclease Mrr
MIEVLKSLGGEGRSSDAMRLICNKLKITKQEMMETTESGNSKIHAQIRAAKLFLAKTGVVTSSPKNTWTLTQKGMRSNLKKHNVLDFYRKNRGYRAFWFKPVDADESEPRG